MKKPSCAFPVAGTPCGDHQHQGDCEQDARGNAFAGAVSVTDGAVHGGMGPIVPHGKAAAARATAFTGSFSLELLGGRLVVALVTTRPIPRPPGMELEVAGAKSLVTRKR